MDVIPFIHVFQIIVTKGSLIRKIKVYFDWKNTLDFFGVLLFIVGMVLRLAAKEHDASRVCFAFSFVCFTVRVLALSYISELMGPKLVIISRMVRLIDFICSCN